MTLTEQWRDAVAGVHIRHPDRAARPDLVLLDGDPPALEFWVRNATDTVSDERIASLAVSTVRLTYFPGTDVARRWIAAAWCGYQQHEALELVTLDDGTRPLDPHGDPVLDRGLRQGVPVELTPETLMGTFRAIMPEHLAQKMAR